MTKERRYCDEVMKKKQHFNKKFLLTKKNPENFKSSTNCWICNKDFLYNTIKVKDHFRITGKYIGSAQIVILGSN